MLTTNLNVPFSCDVGDLIRLFATFTNYDKEPIDPTTIIVKVKQPSGSILPYEGYNPGPIVRTSLGNFYLDVSVIESGTWYYRWEATGEGQCAAERNFMARPSFFEPTQPALATVVMTPASTAIITPKTVVVKRRRP